MKRKLLAVVLAIILVLSLALTGCGKGAVTDGDDLKGDTQQGDTPQDDERSGGKNTVLRV